jgi:hypothetical protein
MLTEKLHTVLLLLWHPPGTEPQEGPDSYQRKTSAAHLQTT